MTMINVSNECMWRDMKKLIISVIQHNFILIGSRNFALFRLASQSSTFEWSGNICVASRAVDGDTVGGNAISSTDYGDRQPWWKVRLAYPVWVSHVEITNNDNDQSEYHPCLPDSSFRISMNVLKAKYQFGTIQINNKPSNDLSVTCDYCKILIWIGDSSVIYPLVRHCLMATDKNTQKSWL